MKKIIYILAILFAIPAFAQQDSRELFAEANNLYQQKEYEKALEDYKSIMEMGYESADLYYNMGNCYYRTGQLAPAILFYERALKLAPKDKDAAYNLAIAQQKTVDDIEEVPMSIVKKMWLGFVNSFAADTWGVLTIILFVMAIALLVIFRMSENVKLKKLLFFTTLLLLLAGVVTLSAGYSRYGIQNQKEAIVFAQTAYVKSEPNQTSDNAFVLHEGTKATITEQFDGWSRIQLQDGKTGWIAQADIVEI